MRNMKNNDIDNNYLKDIVLKSNLKDTKCYIKIDNKQIDETTDLSNIPEQQYFISVNPKKHISANKLKEILKYSYRRYSRYKLGKNYDLQDYPIKLDIVLEKSNNDVYFNHFHIITETMPINDFIIFLAIIYLYMTQEIPHIDIMAEDCPEQLNALTYALKIQQKNGKIIERSNDVEFFSETSL